MSTRTFAPSHSVKSAFFLVFREATVLELGHLYQPVPGGWLGELSDHVLRKSWVGEGKATIFLGKHSARKFLLVPLRIRGEGPIFPQSSWF